MKKRFSLGLAVLFCVVMSFLTLNCETGLGPAVDVEPPRLSITYPPANVAVRDAFVLAGTCSDDQGVKTVTVTIHKDNKLFAGPYEATVAEDGKSWSIKLNEGKANSNACPPLVPLKNYPLKDGTYVFRVQATDKAGRKSDEIASSYDIDNTAPILLLNKPLGVEDEKPTSYGRVLRFAGDASDDHALSLSLYWQEYDKPLKNGKPNPIGEIKSIEVKNVSSMSSDAPLVVAKYFPNPKGEDQQTLTTNYVKIYGTPGPLGKNKDKFFYAGIRLSDSAKVYQNPSEKENKSSGNTTDTYFVYSDDLSDTLTKYGTDGIKAGDLKRILNGSDTTYSADVINTVKTALSTSEKDKRNFVKCVGATDVTTASNIFKMNPDNQPTWSIGGFAIGEENDYADPNSNNYRPYSEGNSLTVSLMPNNDKDMIRPKNIDLYIQKYDSAGNKVDGARHKIIRNVNDTNSPKAEFWDEEQTNESASMNIQIGTKKDEIKLKPKEYWKFELIGEDAGENEYIEDNGGEYGFVVAAAETVSTINVSSPAENSYFAISKLAETDGIVISGTLTDQNKMMVADGATDDEGNPLYPFTCHVTVTNANTGDAFSSYDVAQTDITCENVKVPVPGSSEMQNSETFKWTVKIKKDDVLGGTKEYGTLKTDFDPMNYNFSFAFVATNAAKISTPKQFALKGDNKKPTLNITNVEFVDSSATPPYKTNSLVTEESDSINNDHTQFTLTGDWGDVAGSGTGEFYYWFGKPNLTTNPVTLPTIPEKGTGSPWINPKLSTSKNNTDEKADWNIKIPVEELGEGWVFAVWAKDGVGNETDIVSVSGVNFDFSKPVIKFDAFENKILSQEKIDTHETKIEITGTVEDGNNLTSGPLTVTVKHKKHGFDYTEATDGTDYNFSQSQDDFNKKKWTWKIALRPDAQAEGDWTFTLNATDAAGRTTKVDSKVLSVDVTPPEIIDTPKIDDVSVITTGDPTWIKNTEAPALTASYKEQGTGNTKLYYWVYKDGDTIPDADGRKALKNASATGSFPMVETNATAGTWGLGKDGVGEEITKGLGQGKYKVYIRAVDAAGNESTGTDLYLVWIDTKAPTVTYGGWRNSGDTGDFKTTAINTKVANGIDIKVTAADATSDMQTVTFKLKKAGATTSTVLKTTSSPAEITDNGDGTWTISKDVFAEGENVISAIATDKAGNNSDEKELCTVVVDTTPPKFAITSVTDADKPATAVDGATYVLTNDSVNSIVKIDNKKYKFTLSGTWSDIGGSGTDVIYYSTIGADDLTNHIKNGTNKVKIAQQSSVAEGQWSQTFEINVGDQSKHSYWVQAFDKVENSPGVISLENIIFDFADPKVEVDETTIPSITNLARPLTVTIKVSDDRKLANEPLAITFTKDGVNFDAATSTNIETPPLPTWIDYYEDKTTTPPTKVPAPHIAATYTVTFTSPGNVNTLDGKWKIKAIATDEVGRKSVEWESKEFEIDCTKPELLADTGSVTNFKFGGKNRAELGATEHPWFNATAIKAIGNYKEDQSGIEAVYYWTGDNETTVTAGTIANATSTFGAGIDGTNWKFEGMVASGLQAGKNYVKFIAVDKAGNQSDPLGPLPIHIDMEMPEVNPSAESTTYSNGKHGKEYNGTLSDDASGVVNFSFELGRIKIASTETGNTITPTLDKITDDSVIKIKNPAGDEIELSAQDANKVRTWKVSLTAASLASLGNGTFVAYGIAEDKAGNKSSKTRLFSIIIDVKAPEGKITQPGKDSTVNKEFKMQGNANDNTELASVTLEWSTDTGATKTYNPFSPAIKFTDNKAYNWVTDDIDSETAFGTLTYSDPWKIDTSTNEYIITDPSKRKFSADNSAEITLKAVAVDEAKNSTEDDGQTPITQKFFVNQHSDRPIINITSINSAGEIAKYTTQLKGNVLDDDNDGTNVVKTFIATSDSFSFDSSGNIIVKDNGETEFVESTGDWTFTPKNKADGMKEVYFYIVDNAGNEFYSVKGRSSEKTPYLQFQGKADNRTTLGEKFEFGIDNTVPDIDSGLIFYHGTGETGYDPATATGARILTLSDSSSVYVGGTKCNFLQFEFTAKDKNGIKEMSAVFYKGSTAIAGQSYTYKDGASSGNTGTKDDKPADADGKKASVWTLPLGEITNKDPGWKDGNYSVSLTVTDGAGITNVQKYLFITDFTEPEVNMTSPADGTIIIASTDIKANFTDNGAGMAAGGAKWIIPTKTQNADHTTITDAEWNDVGITMNKHLDWKAISRYSNTDGTTSYATEKSGKLEVPVLFKVVDELGNDKIVPKTITIDPEASKAKADIVYPTDGAKVSSSLTLSGTASVDEGRIKEVRVKIDANGDGKYDEADYRILSGAATAADINGFLSKVIKSTSDETKAEYLKALNGTASDPDGWKAFAAETPVDSRTAATNKRLVKITKKEKVIEDGVEVEKDVLKDWYIIADGTNSWKLTLDMSLFAYTYSKYTNGTENPQVNFMAVAWAEQENIDASSNARTYSGYEYKVDGTEDTTKEHIRAWPLTKTVEEAKEAGTAKFSVTVDTGVPTISNIKIVQYAETDPTKITATTATKISRAYEAGMFVSPKVGNNVWYLVATIGDETALASYKVSSVDKSGKFLEFKDKKSNDDATFKTELTDAGVAGLKTYTLRIPLTTKDTKDGQFHLAIEPTDKTGKTGQQYVSIFTDGSAPIMARESDKNKANAGPDDKDDNGNAKDAIRFTDSLSQILGEAALIENTDGVFEFGGIFEEKGGSDLAYLAFWFERQPRSSGATLDEKRVYNPMIAPGTQDSDKRYENQTKLEDAKADGKLYINDEGLAVVEMDATRGTDANGKSTITVTNNDNIRQGGLVKIDGFYYMITNNASGVLTLDKTIEPTPVSTKVEIVYAQVVNRKGRETDENGKIVNDDGTKDGDGMNETLKATGSMYTWRAEFDSKNIPDGPIIVHVTAIDGAGNLEKGSLKTMVANNRPRVTRVMVGTDWNADGKFKVGDGVKDIKNVADATQATESGTEFGEFVYYSTIDRALDNSKLTDATDRENAMAKAVVTLKGGGTFIVSNRLCVIPRFTGGNGAALKYGWEVLDEDKTQTKKGTNDLRRDSTGKVDVDNDTVTDGKLCLDGKAAEVSSLIQSGTKYGGLILKNSELEPHESWTKTSQKVKYINFTFWDDTDETLQGDDSLWALVKLPCYINVVDDVAPKAYINPFYWTSWEDSSTYIDKETDLPQGHIDSLEEDLLANNQTLANPKVSGKVYIAGTAEDETRLKSISVRTPDGVSGLIATYVNGNWETAKSGLANNWDKGSIVIKETCVPGQKGHKVEYKVAIDMTEYGVGTGKQIFATAMDGSINKNESIADASAAQTTKDEPTCRYEVDFVPYIKSVSDKNVEDAPRSRLGRYPVRAGEDIYINGMNFKGPCTVNFYKSDTTGGQGSETVKDSVTVAANNGSVKVKAPDYSCWIEVTVGGLKTPNNTNENTVGYNVQKGKFRLNAAKTRMEAKDDVEGADFWVDDCYLSVWKVGTEFVNSPNSVKGTIERMSEYTVNWKENTMEGYKSNTGSYPDGTLFGIWGGEDNMIWDNVLGDTARTQNAAGSADAFFKSPPSQVDVCIVDGDTTSHGSQMFYAILDDGWSDAGTFGQGLLLLREGMWATGDTTARWYALEHTKNDKQRDQFQNPKVAGYYGPNSVKADTAQGKSDTVNSYHVYASYYDKYTHCLKYGRVEFFDNVSVSQNDSDHMLESGVRTMLKNKNDAVIVDGTDAAGGDDVGMWSDIKIIDKKPVIIYYDRTHKKLKYAKANASIPTSWDIGDLNKPTRNSDFGRYVSIEVDGGNNIHIVAQDANNGVLYYGYTSSLGSDIDWHKVDATSSVGRWTDIKLEVPAAKGYAAKPVITYMDAAYLNTNKAVKIAYFDKATTVTVTDDNGVEVTKDIVSFDAMTDPTTYEASDMKLSIVTKPREKNATSYSRYGIGINSTAFIVDFLRGEEAIDPDPSNP